MSLGQGVRRLGADRIRVQLSAQQRTLLRSLPDQLRPLLSGQADIDSPEGSVAARLFPAAYEDPLDEIEYRELIADSTGESRLAALDDFAATLAEGRENRSGWRTELSDEQALAWLSAINDARLTLAMVIGVADEREWARGPDAADANSIALHYLGWLQEDLLRALSGALAEPAVPPSPPGE